MQRHDLVEVRGECPSLRYQVSIEIPKRDALPRCHESKSVFWVDDGIKRHPAFRFWRLREQENVSENIGREGGRQRSDHCVHTYTAQEGSRGRGDVITIPITLFAVFSAAVECELKEPFPVQEHKFALFWIINIAPPTASYSVI